MWFVPTFARASHDPRGRFRQSNTNHGNLVSTIVITTETLSTIVITIEGRSVPTEWRSLLGRIADVLSSSGHPIHPASRPARLSRCRLTKHTSRSSLISFAVSVDATDAILTDIQMQAVGDTNVA